MGINVSVAIRWVILLEIAKMCGAQSLKLIMFPTPPPPPAPSSDAGPDPPPANHDPPSPVGDPEAVVPVDPVPVGPASEGPASVDPIPVDSGASVGPVPLMSLDVQPPQKICDVD